MILPSNTTQEVSVACNKLFLICPFLLPYFQNFTPVQVIDYLEYMLTGSLPPQLSPQLHGQLIFLLLLHLPGLACYFLAMEEREAAGPQPLERNFTAVLLHDKPRPLLYYPLI